LKCNIAELLVQYRERGGGVQSPAISKKELACKSFRKLK
jgi:hypothetical protein